MILRFVDTDTDSDRQLYLDSCLFVNFCQAVFSTVQGAGIQKTRVPLPTYMSTV